MSAELLPGLATCLQNWVIKKGADHAPSRVTDADLDDIARAAVETLRQRAVGETGEEWGSLSTLTRGWLVQREKGQKPSVLNQDDFRPLVVMVLEGLSRPRGQGDTEQAVMTHEGEQVMPPSSVSADAAEGPHGADPFRFAREHLARAL